MSRTDKLHYLKPDDDKLLDFDLAGRRSSRVTNLRRKKPANRSAIACVALLPLVGILFPKRDNSSLDGKSHTALTNRNVAVEAAAPSTQTETLLSADGPYPDLIDELEAPVISDATSPPVAGQRVSQSEKREPLLVDDAKPNPVAPAPAIPMSAFPTDERIWTKSSGKYLLGSALAYDELKGSVMLRSSDGRVLSTVAVEELCPADLEFLSQLTGSAADRTSE